MFPPQGGGGKRQEASQAKGNEGAAQGFWNADLDIFRRDQAKALAAGLPFGRLADRPLPTPEEGTYQ